MKRAGYQDYNESALDPELCTFCFCCGEQIIYFKGYAMPTICDECEKIETNEPLEEMNTVY
jgi:hypothetical protein